VRAGLRTGVAPRARAAMGTAGSGARVSLPGERGVRLGTGTCLGLPPGRSLGLRNRTPQSRELWSRKARSLEPRNRRLQPLRQGSRLGLSQSLESRQSLGTGRTRQGPSLGMSRKLLSQLKLSLLKLSLLKLSLLKLSLLNLGLLNPGLLNPGLLKLSLLNLSLGSGLAPHSCHQQQ
jgi:hypothetical protein